MMARNAVVDNHLPRLFIDAGAGGGAFQYRRGSTVYVQGDTADGAYYVVSGRLILSTVSPEGKEAIVGIVNPREFLGEDCFAEKAVRTYTAVALEASCLLHMERRDLRNSLRRSPDLADDFLSHLLHRNRSIRESLAEFHFCSSEQRLARVLLRLAERTPDWSETACLPRISQSMLAAMVGTTRSRISHFLGQFRRIGLIDNGRVIRINRRRLLSLAGCGPVLAEAPSRARQVGRERHA